MYVCSVLCMHVFMFVSKYVCMNVCMYVCLYYLRSIHCYVYIDCLYHTNLMRFDALHGLLNLTTIRKQGLYYNK